MVDKNWKDAIIINVALLLRSLENKNGKDC